MKRLIIIITMATGLAYGQKEYMYDRGTYGGGGCHYPITNTGTVNVIDDKAIKRLIENGDVCRVRGKHEWRYKDSRGEYSLLDVWITPDRKCDLCGRKEIKQEEWKEDGK